PIDRPPKYWQIQMAFTEYKNGKWTPKIVSNGDASGSLIIFQNWDDTQSDPLTQERGVYVPQKTDFVFTPLDIPSIDFKRLFKDGNPNDPKNFLNAVLQGIVNSLTSNGDLQINCYLQYDANSYGYQGTFDLDPCKGYPVTMYKYDSLVTTLFDRSRLANM